MLTRQDTLWAPRRIEPLFKLLNDQQYERLSAEVEVRTFLRHQYVFKAGDQPTHMMYVQSGKVTLEYLHPNGNMLIARLVEPGRFFGFRESFAGECYTVSARTDDDTRIAMIPLPLIKSLMQENPNVTSLLMTELTDAINAGLNHTTFLLQKQLRGRAAYILLSLKQQFGTRSDGQTLAIYVSRKDMANLSNMTTSNCIRTLSAFASEGLITIEGRLIRILNEQALSDIMRRG